jgi:hypothetical protein
VYLTNAADPVHCGFVPDQPPPAPGAARSGLTEWVHTCERCGERMDERTCKIICPNCGFYRDCTDP